MSGCDGEVVKGSAAIGASGRQRCLCVYVFLHACMRGRLRVLLLNSLAPTSAQEPRASICLCVYAREGKKKEGGDKNLQEQIRISLRPLRV